ncbi:hypothetical protein SAMN05660489_03106 [Pseudomonas sp. LAMO17WK12:I10]|nr:hypothetical protein H160_03009 [Pseudomonas sp. LAMO17WK12:I9]SNY34412.1 hypothetical protein SAMN05660489_03106 [Pseudomonas sp. LAMO17WK12:I10]
MNPSATEKLILQMLCDVHKHLGIKDSYDPDLISRAVGSDDYWVLNWKYDIREENAENPPHVRAVVDALDMFRRCRQNKLKLPFLLPGQPRSHA